MRIVSLLPSATEIVYALGLGGELVGRTHECDFPTEVSSVPIMTADVGGAPTDSGREIHLRVAGAVHGGSSLYRLDAEALTAARPDLILTQELCDVCAVSYREVTRAVRAIGRETGAETSVVSLEPTSLEGILNSISTVGAMAEAEDEAVGLIEILRERLGAIENRVLERRLSGVRPRRVVCLEWLDPPFAAGHWVPEQVRRAGGWDLLGREGERSQETTWEAVREVDPEQLLLMPCGFDTARTAEEFDGMSRPPWFDELRAVRAGETFALDGSGYFSRPGPRIIDGIALLAELFDPEGFVDVAPPEAWVPVGPAYPR
ncbi:MAG: cobalamin-binding protein [Chloroflexota bacterium]|nr:cobalamin-binding protein [Chloroflexota bacterium]